MAADRLQVFLHASGQVPNFGSEACMTALGWSESFAGKCLNDSAHAHQSLIAADSDRLLYSRNRSLDCGLSTVQARTIALACCDKRITPRRGRRPARLGGVSNVPKAEGRDERRRTGPQHNRPHDEVVHGFRFSLSYRGVPVHTKAFRLSGGWSPLGFLVAAGAVAG